MYAGPAYVYFAQADDPEAALLAEASISLARRGHTNAEETIFASVVGGLTGLNFLSRLQRPQSVVLFDINPWMVEYAAFIVELARMSPTRSEWLGRLFSRNATHFMETHGTTRFSNALEDAFYGLPVDAELAASTTQQLSAPSKCVFRWFTEHVAPNPMPKAPPKTRRVCERLRLSDQPRSDWSENSTSAWWSMDAAWEARPRNVGESSTRANWDLGTAGWHPQRITHELEALF